MVTISLKQSHFRVKIQIDINLQSNTKKVELKYIPKKYINYA